MEIPVKAKSSERTKAFPLKCILFKENTQIYVLLFFEEFLIRIPFYFIG